MQRFLKTTFVIALTICMTSCATVNKVSGLAVNVPNAFSTVQAGAGVVMLKAMVINSDQGVTWGLSQASVPCSPACGTLVPGGSSGDSSLTAKYTPPNVLPTNTTATITATSLENHKQAFVFNFTITPGVTVTISDKFTSQVAGGAPVEVDAVVANDAANAGVTWTLTAAGSSCSPACGTLVIPTAPTLSVSYVPPTTLPTGAAASPTITATSVTNTSASDSFSFTLQSANALLTGSYAFLLRGYDVAGSPMAMAGSVTADGKGNITGGEFDVDNDGGITHAPSPLNGTYTLDLSSGVVRGTIVITNFQFPGNTGNASFKFVLSSDGKNGTILELDGIGYRNSGTIQLQDPSALSAANAAGSYAFGLDSDAPVGGSIAEVGAFTIAQTGGVTGLVDQSKAGDASPAYSATPIDPSSSASTPDASGRGTLSLTIAGTTSQYAYYVVNANQLNLVQTDPGRTFGTAQGGVAFLQKQLPLPANSIYTSSVVQLTGMDSPHGTQDIGPDVIIGVMTMTQDSGPNGDIFNIMFDANDLGQITTSHPATGFVSFDPTTGRGQIRVAGGFNTGFVNSAVFYLYDTGKGFILDADPSTPDGTPPDQAVTNNAFSGTFLQQVNTSTTPITNQSLSGNLILRSGASAIPDIPNVAAAISVDNTAGTYTATGDLTSLDSQIGNSPNITFTGTYSIVDGTLGHGTMTFPSGFYGNFTSSLTYNASFYMIAPNQFVAIGIENGVYSGVTFVNPD